MYNYTSLPRTSRDFSRTHGIESSSNSLWVSLRGRLVFQTFASTKRCWEAVRAGFKPSVVLDLSEVTLMDSTVLGSLVGLRRWLESRGSCLRISAMSPEVRRVLTVTRLDRIFAIADEPRDTSASPDRVRGDRAPKELDCDSNPGRDGELLAP
jgi:anti-sigma B factor antagonist